MKKKILIILVFILVFSLMNGCAINSDYKYENNGDGTCRIIKYQGEQSGDLIIPEKINGLRVTSIDETAFLGCTGFTGSLVIPEGVTYIGGSAFAGCSGLTGNLVIPDSVRRIESDAFYNCHGFTSISLSKGVEKIAVSTFAYCRGIEYIDVSEQNTAFSSLDGILFNREKSVLILAPRQMKKENYVIPTGVTAIARNAFLGCTGFTGNLTIPDSVKVINENAFAGCFYLTGNLFIPASVKEIGTAAFSACMEMTSIEVSESNEHYSSLDGVLYDKSKTKLICVPAGMKRENFTVPEGVGIIEYAAFQNCLGMTGSITLPDSIAWIRGNAFENCDRLNQVEFLGDAPHDFGRDVFADCAADFRIIYGPAKMGWSTPEWNGYPAFPKS